MFFNTKIIVHFKNSNNDELFIQGSYISYDTLAAINRSPVTRRKKGLK